MPFLLGYGPLNTPPRREEREIQTNCEARVLENDYVCSNDAKQLMICSLSASRDPCLSVMQTGIHQKADLCLIMDKACAKSIQQTARQPAYLNIVKQENGHVEATEILAAVPMAVSHKEF